MDLPKRIELIEVCPRDGFQNVHDIIPFEGKVYTLSQLTPFKNDPDDGRRLAAWEAV